VTVEEVQECSMSLIKLPILVFHDQNFFIVCRIIGIAGIVDKKSGFLKEDRWNLPLVLRERGVLFFAIRVISYCGNLGPAT
jgi:hypothetical protein